jgi:hypothetical protein
MAKDVIKQIGQPIDVEVFIKATNVTYPLEFDVSVGIVSRTNPNSYTSSATKAIIDKDGTYKVRLTLDTSKCFQEGGYDLKMFAIGYGKTLAEKTVYSVVHLYKTLATLEIVDYELY